MTENIENRIKKTKQKKIHTSYEQFILGCRTIRCR